MWAGKIHSSPARLCLAALMLAIATPISAAIVNGKVSTPPGSPVVGALVTLIDNNGLAESVYTNRAGQYRLATALAGQLELRVRKRYYRDDLRAISLDANGEIDIDMSLVAITDAQELSDAHPALSHFARIAFDADDAAPFSRANFARDCLSCHALGNATTRWPRPPQGWVPTVHRMHAYLANADEAMINKRAALLSAAFDGSLASSRPQVATDPLLETAKIYEWKLAGAVVPHDAAYDPGNGKIYSSEMFTGEILETDLETGETLHFKLPAHGSPPGGAFTKMGLPAPYGLTTSRAPHSLARGLDGRWYMTDSIGAAITVFDPKTREFESFDIGGDALYPHTVRADQAGVIWFTISLSNQVGRFDPKTHDMKVFDLPATPSLSTPGTPIPYGIAVHPMNGGIWYAKLASDKIGHIDAATFTITEYDSPVRAPRRQRFDAAGNLWIAGFSDGAIARVDVASWQFKIYRLPVLAPGEIPAPYALAVHPQTQDIWVNDTMLDVVWRFLPSEERFVTYPMPLRGTYTRDFTFTDAGWACTANNPIPAPALEGGVPELICIDAGDPAAQNLANQQ